MAFRRTVRKLRRHKGRLATIEVRAAGYTLPLFLLLVGCALAYRAAARRFDTDEIT